tara:strand:+ start:105 stop:308 length:204 start_codon:yes stop_codon:yes gene_type:complete
MGNIETKAEDFLNKYEENLNEKEHRSLHYMGSVIKCSESDLINLMTQFAEKMGKESYERGLKRAKEG